jgi:hypothetical protein
VNVPTNRPSPASAQSYPAPSVRHTSHTRLFVILGVALAVVIAVVVAASVLLIKPPPQPQCPQDCQGPPTRVPTGTVEGGPPVPTGLPNPPAGAEQGFTARSETRGAPPVSVGEVVPQAERPVESFRRFRRSDGAFSVAYPAGATVSKNGVSWKKSGGEALFFSVPADNLTARQIAEQFIKADFPNAKLAYEIPNARVGYQLGYGEIDDFVPQSGSGTYKPQRVLIMVAIKNGLALIAEAAGPLSKPEDEAGHPSGANLEIAGWMGYFVNSFSWKGDPLR